MQPRTVALIATLSLAAGWLVSSKVSPGSQATSAPDMRGPRPLGRQDPVAPFTEQLRLKMRDHPRSPSTGRNPFLFGSGRRLAVSPERGRAAEPPAVSTEPEPIVAAPVRPRFQLSGIASEHHEGADVLTAIVNDNGSLVFVKAGDQLAGGYRVVRVEENAVVIADASGAEQTYHLK